MPVILIFQWAKISARSLRAFEGPGPHEPYGPKIVDEVTEATHFTSNKMLEEKSVCNHPSATMRMF
jgi:hypothetical protein